MNHLSLFSGIGGLDLAAEWAGFETVAFVERDPYCQRVLAKRWPGVPIFGDVQGVNAETLSNAAQLLGDGREHHAGGGGEGRRALPEPRDRCGRIQLVSGGFPCQPHSVAGKRQASADDRDLWPEVARVLREIRPRWFVGENVRGLLHSESGRFFGSILGDLADMGYRVGWGVWGASDVGALHRRERVFIVAHADGAGGDQQSRIPMQPGEGLPDANGGGGGGPGAGRGVLAYAERERGCRGDSEREDAADAGQSPGREEPRSWEFEPDVGGMATRLSYWLDEPDIPRVARGVPDRVSRLRALGNAVVPQQAYPLFKAIAEIEMSRPLTRRGTV